MGDKIGPLNFSNNMIHVAGKIFSSLQLGKGRFCILNYHRILHSQDPLLDSEPDVETFRWQMEMLAESFNVIPLCDAVENLSNQAIPPRTVCITFDDGYRSVHDLALPILKELNLPATVFVTTGHIAEGNMWNDNIIEAIRCLPSGILDLSEVGLGKYALGQVGSRKEVIHNLIEASKYFPPRNRRALDKKLIDLLGSTPVDRLMLTQEMLVTLSREGLDIGGHTITHPILTSLDDEMARKEIIENKMQLESIIGKQVRLFAYPNGKTGTDYNERHVRMVKEAGYMAAFTTLVGAVTSNHDRYQIPRSRPWDTNPFMFGLRLLRWLAT